MIQLASEQKCTGCMACVQSCHLKAVTIDKDLLGHIYPYIDKDKCIGCKKCVKSCPELNKLACYTPMSAYAVWSLNPEIRKASTSGGAAAEFYKYALDAGYWICGAEYDNNCNVLHTLRKDVDSIKRYRQSKYVYSDSLSVYSQIESLLLKGEKVICISLPCKIAGILSYLGKVYEKLITVDIVCHGAPSSQNLIEHIEHIVSDIQDVQVRFREDNEYMLCLEKAGKMLYRKAGRTDTYLAAFLEGLDYRNSCYQCAYAKAERISDITICDFWGLGKEIPFEHPYTGSISAVLINSEGGRSFFNECRSHFFAEERPVSEVIKGNTQLNQPTPIHFKRKEFEELYQKVGFEKAVACCLKQEMCNEAKKLRKKNIRRNMRKIAGVFLTKYRR